MNRCFSDVVGPQRPPSKADDVNYDEDNDNQPEVITRKRADSWYARLFNLRLARANTLTDDDGSNYFNITGNNNNNNNNLPLVSRSSATSSCSHRPAIGDDSTTLAARDDLFDIISTPAHYQNDSLDLDTKNAYPWMRICVATTSNNPQILQNSIARKSNVDLPKNALDRDDQSQHTTTTTERYSQEGYQSPQFSPLFSPRTKRPPKAAANLFGNDDSQSDEEYKDTKGSPKTTTNANSHSANLSPIHMPTIGYSVSSIN